MKINYNYKVLQMFEWYKIPVSCINLLEIPVFLIWIKFVALNKKI